MLTPAIPNWLNKSIWKGLEFEEMTACAKKWIKYVKEYEKPDLIFGLFHSGLDGGIKTDDAGNVLTADGSVIDNLFAAGEVTGGIHGANRLGGNGVADIVVNGKIAGRGAAMNCQ